MRTSDRLRWPVLIVFLVLVFGLTACSPDSSDSARDASRSLAPAPAQDADSSRTSGDGHGGTITAENVLEHEQAWPDIVALVEPWTPPGADRPLKAGYRGALIRVETDGRARIAFGRHGNQLIPLELTDLVQRANEVETGARHKIAPNFLAHFGTQFLHPALEELLPFPTPELAKSTRFLCVFAKPSEASFPALAGRLASLGDVAGLQLLFFPLDVPQGSAEAVKSTLAAADWFAPFAYPQAAEVHALKLLGEVPAVATALLITNEGRSLVQLPLDQNDAIERLRAAAIEY